MTANPYRKIGKIGLTTSSGAKQKRLEPRRSVMMVEARGQIGPNSPEDRPGDDRQAETVSSWEIQDWLPSSIQIQMQWKER